MHDDTLASPLLPITIDGTPHVRVAADRLAWLPSGADGEEPPPADAPPADPPAADPPAGDPPAEDPPAEGALEPVPDLPDDLQAADEADLRTLHATYRERRELLRPAARTGADLDALRDLVGRENAIAAEIQRRRDDEQRVVAELSELDEAQPADLPAETAPAVPAMASVSAAAVASARGTQPPVAQTPPAAARPRAVLAAAGGTDVVQGTELSMAQLGALVDRHKKGPDGDAILASLPAFEDDPAFRDDCLSIRNGYERTDEQIHEAVADWRLRRAGRGAEARVAAICDPLEPIRDTPQAFSAAEPVAAMFPSRPAGRLGFQFTPPMILSDVASGVTLWDEADQAAVSSSDSGTWKPCVAVVCPSVDEVKAEFVPGCLTYDVTTEMSNPERIRSANEALAAVRARTKEGRILQLLDLASSKYRFTADYGAVPALIEALNTIIAQAAYVNRLDAVDFDLILPPAAAAVLTIDRANRAYGVEEAASGPVLDYIRSNVDGLGRIVVSLDASLGGQPGVPFTAFPLSTDDGGPAGLTNLPFIEGGDYRLRLVDPSGWIYAETGEMNAGVTRDSNQLRQNKSQYFTESAFMLAKHGPQPAMTIDMVLCADGSRAGLVTPDACANS